MRRVLSEIECLEWEARQQPSPPPRRCEPWELVLARQDELRRNWLPRRAYARSRDMPQLITNFEEAR